ncbi:response regulator [Phenylobacterium sp. LjRoot225]|uniref:response regulator n=1 Tax=Phenylobacterium sp. LjRoot225 TaxID=3342285 RepID=UPI003F50B813
MGTGAAIDSVAEVLLVEDDEELRAEMAAYLQDNGYAISQAASVPEARRVLQSRPIQVAVLDINLPGEDGLSLCRALADAGGPAILMLTAQGEPIDRILGLELGADDYVVKPILPRELLARVKALLRRRTPGASNQKRTSYRFAGFLLDLAAHKLQAPNGMTLLLTRSELALLTALLNKAQKVVSRDELTVLLKGDEPDVSGRSIDLHISRLRRKIQDQADGEIIRTYRGVGYMLDVKVASE